MTTITETIRTRRTPAEQTSAALKAIARLEKLSKTLATNQKQAVLSAIQTQTEQLTEAFSETPQLKSSAFSLPAAK
jgi:succinylarginine dihydrolase